MKVLVVGAGAREHAICWRLATDGAEVVVAPGNPLMSDVADVRGNVALADHEGQVALARKQKVDLVVVGPEAPLVAGLVDRLPKLASRLSDLLRRRPDWRQASRSRARFAWRRPYRWQPAAPSITSTRRSSTPS